MLLTLLMIFIETVYYSSIRFTIIAWVGLLASTLGAVLDSKVFWGDGYSCNIVKGDKELDLQIFSIFWLNSIKQHFNGKMLIWRSRETGLTKGPLFKTLHLMEQDITSNDKENTTFPVSPSPNQFARVALLEQFWHFKNLFLTFLSKCVSPLSHFLKLID